MLADDDEEATPTVGPAKGQTSQQPAWMRNLHDRCCEWLGQLPSVGLSGYNVFHLASYFSRACALCQNNHTTIQTPCIDSFSVKGLSDRIYSAKFAGISPM
jgi:hypothetical protein